MNIAKHMEAIFLAAATLTLVTGYAQADDAVTQQQTVLRTAVIEEVQTVTVTAKRLSAAEKAAQ